MADANGRFVLHQHQGHRLADDIARSDNDDVLAFERNILVLKQFQHAIRRARRKHRAADHEAADIVEVKPVDILVRRNGAQNASHVE
jgi:hypothetical protein